MTLSVATTAIPQLPKPYLIFAMSMLIPLSAPTLSVYLFVWIWVCHSRHA